MRTVAIGILLGLSAGAALAQGSAPSAAPNGSAAVGIARDDYIAKAKEAAEKRAAKRFDAMDANHDGVLTGDEVAAYRAAHPRKKRNEPEQ
ncbi:MAG: hypothetical protein JO032_08665 [Alphaproteobacteria bacterium]|nr:hypothetical protein [Alphaproteobacteria bacterium]MBV9552847.1 hypothetical protein [Alphaproteobacteria bacterium]